MGLYVKTLRKMVQLAGSNLQLGERPMRQAELEDEGTSRDAPEGAVSTAGPVEAPSQHDAAVPTGSCSTCNVHALLADAHAILLGAAQVCPQEGLAWDYVGGFASARQKVQQAIGALAAFERLGGRVEAGQLRLLLPQLEQRLASIADCPDVVEVEGLAANALHVAFEGQRAVRRQREQLFTKARDLAHRVHRGEMTKEQAVTKLREAVT